jgi:hypothetical protein
MVELNEPLVRQLCATHTVMVFNGQSAAEYGLNIIPWHSPRHLVALRQVMAELNCGRPIRR